MKTFTPKPTEIMRQWRLIDASGQVMGRLATEVSRLLMGKNKPIFTRNLDTGDFVVVTNVSKIRVTGKKETDKMYYRHSGYPGGFREETYREVVAKNPTRAFEKAVKGMLPHTRLGAAMLRKLKVYAGPEHPHAAQVAAPPAPKKAVPKKPVAPRAEIAPGAETGPE
ncbi:MAG: 50S ribosomal protein L13 [Chloroflexi bacterium]|nr:50S ribosomal protein L13 [Chloroflexota bacterium]